MTSLPTLYALTDEGLRDVLYCLVRLANGQPRAEYRASTPDAGGEGAWLLTCDYCGAAVQLPTAPATRTPVTDVAAFDVSFTHSRGCTVLTAIAVLDAWHAHRERVRYAGCPVYTQPPITTEQYAAYAAARTDAQQLALAAEMFALDDTHAAKLARLVARITTIDPDTFHLAQMVAEQARTQRTWGA